MHFHDLFHILLWLWLNSESILCVHICNLHCQHFYFTRGIKILSIFLYYTSSTFFVILWLIAHSIAVPTKFWIQETYNMCVCVCLIHHFRTQVTSHTNSFIWAPPSCHSLHLAETQLIPKSLLMLPTTNHMLMLPTTNHMLMLPTTNHMLMLPTTNHMLMLPTTNHMLMLPTTNHMLMLPTTNHKKFPPLHSFYKKSTVHWITYLSHQFVISTGSKTYKTHINLHGHFSNFKN